MEKPGMAKQKVLRFTLNDNKEWEVPSGWRVVMMTGSANDSNRSVYVLLEQVLEE